MWFSRASRLIRILADRVSFRFVAAVAVAAVGADGVLSASTPSLTGRERLLGRTAPVGLPSAAHLLALLAGLVLVVLAPRLWRGARTAASLAAVWLAVLAVLNLARGLAYDQTALDLCLLAVLVLGRRAFPLGSRSRPRLVVVGAALGAWGLAGCAELIGPAIADRGHTLRLALRHTVGHMLSGYLSHPRPDSSWVVFVELLLGCAVAASLLALRSWTDPAPDPGGHDELAHRAARDLVEQHGDDSISPFILRPDKSFHFAAGGVLAYRTIGETAIISGDPVGPAANVPDVLASFLSFARRRGWRVVIWGSSARHLESYRRLGLRFLALGEEAYVDPSGFSLEGRRVRKLRQSVNRVARRGWQIQAVLGRELNDQLEREIDAFETRWSLCRRRVHGFAMSMGPFATERRPDDLHLLARSPEGELRAVMRFVSHRGRLSLDTMHRLGETPNGLNEALICKALELAREHRVSEVSLNYAGLGHWVRRGPAGRRAVRLLARALSLVIGSRFQMDGLVRFDEKFDPTWRPRFLVYQSAAALPLVALRVLQVEGYLPHRARGRRTRPRPVRLPRRLLGGSLQVGTTP